MTMTMVISKRCLIDSMPPFLLSLPKKHYALSFSTAWTSIRVSNSSTPTIE